MSSGRSLCVCGGGIRARPGSAIIRFAFRGGDQTAHLNRSSGRRRCPSVVSCLIIATRGIAAQSLTTLDERVNGRAANGLHEGISRSILSARTTGRWGCGFFGFVTVVAEMPLCSLSDAVIKRSAFCSGAS